MKDKVCGLVNSSGVQAAANLLVSFGVPIAAAKEKVANFCPAKKGTTPGGGAGGSGGEAIPAPTPGLTITAKLPPGNYPAGSAYTQSPTGQYLIFVPFSGAVELGSICVDDWCGAILGDFGQAPQQMTPEQFVALLKANNIATDQALALLGIVPWYKNWKYLVPMAVGVVAAGVGTYYIVRRKKEA
jgi:hypothetical protein